MTDIPGKSNNEDEDIDEVEITIDNLLSAITTDLKKTKQDTQKLNYTVQKDLEHFLRQKSTTLLSGIIDVEQEEHEIQIDSRVSGAEMLFTSIHKMSEKAALDFQIAKLCDLYEVHERDRIIREQYIQKYITLIPEKVLSDFNEINRSNEEQVRFIKSNIEECLKLDEEKGEDEEEEENNLENTFNRAVEDFGIANILMKNEIERAKLNTRNHFYVLFPPTYSIKTTEELESEEFIKEELIEMTVQIRSDILEAKQLSDKLIKQLKRDIRELFQDSEALHGFTSRESSEDLGFLVPLKQSVSRLLIESQSIVYQKMDVEKNKIFLDFKERNKELQVILKDILTETNVIKRSIGEKKSHMTKVVEHILDDITESTQIIYENMDLKGYEILESKKKLEKYTDVFKPENVKETTEERVKEIQQRVSKVRAELQNRFEILSRDLGTKNIELVEKNINERALEALEEAKALSIDTFMKTEEKMNNDVEEIKLKIAEKMEPILQLIPKLTSETEIESEAVHVIEPDVESSSDSSN